MNKYIQNAGNLSKKDGKKQSNRSSQEVKLRFRSLGDEKLRVDR